MIHIKTQTNGFNCNEDSELLGDSYYNLLEILITIFKYTLFILSVYIIWIVASSQYILFCNYFVLNHRCYINCLIISHKFILYSSCFIFLYID